MPTSMHLERAFHAAVERAQEFLAADRFRSAAAAFLVAYRQARRAGDASGMARALYCLGYIYCLMGDPDRAEEFQRRGLALRGISRDERGKLYLNLGLACYQRGDDAGAAHYWEQAEECFTQSGNERFRARCRSNRGLLLLERHPEQARQLLEAALVALERAGDPERYRTQTELARVYLDLRRLDRARRMAVAAWRGAVQARDVVELGRVLTVLAELDHVEGRHSRARSQFEEALCIFGGRDAWEYKRCYDRALRLGYVVESERRASDTGNGRGC